MSSLPAERPFEVIPERACSVRASRLFPRDLADIVCVEEAAADVRPRMHGRFSIILIRTPTVVRLESSRNFIAQHNSILFIPPRHLYALRTATGLVTDRPRPPLILQIGALHGAPLPTATRPAVISDGNVASRLANLVLQLQRPVRLVDFDTEVASMIACFEGCRSEIGLARVGFAVETLVAVRDYLRAHTDDPISTPALSRFSGLTESHLIRSFHREFGLPPHAYQMQLRLAQACEALATGLSVTTVAYECGFADQSHLSRKFKDAYGITPAAWANAVGGVLC